MARKALRLAPMPCLCACPFKNQEAQVSALQCGFQLSLILQAEEGYSPIVFLQILPFGTPDNQTATRTDSDHPICAPRLGWLQLLWVGSTESWA